MALTGVYTWKESEKFVTLTIPLKGTSPKTVDVFAAELVLKVSYPPYLINLDLHAAVDENRSKASVKGGNLTLKLTKKEPGLWISLVADGSPEELAARRAESIEQRSKEQDALTEKVRDRKHEDERKALRKQMSLEHAERQHIEDLKVEEKRDAEQQVYDTFAKLEAERTSAAAAAAAAAARPPQQRADLAKKSATPAAAAAPPPPPPDQRAPAKRATSASANASASIFDESDITLLEDDLKVEDGNDGGAEVLDTGGASVDEPDEPPERALAAPMPGPRGDGTNKVTFGFTPRIFPTPARESKAAEENEWITKNRKHLRKNKALVGSLDALDFSETDPAWLKSKGDEFYKGGDFRSAISAYTSALELEPGMLSSLSNRAACHLRIAELHECIADCTTALEPPEGYDEPDTSARIKLLVRRGTALCQQGTFVASLADYRSAAALDPANAALTMDVERLASLAECDTLKKRADASFGVGSIAEAAALYSEALALEPSFVSCISNRAACHFALNDLPAAIGDCSAALDLLSMDVSQSLSRSSKDAVPSGPVPPAGSDTRRQWVLKTLVRRGAALARQGELPGAIEDYETALAISPLDAALQRDLDQLRAEQSQKREQGEQPLPSE